MFAVVKVLSIFLIVVVLASCDPPRTGINFTVPVHTLERLGFNEGDLFIMLSEDSSCEHEFSQHNYTVMFGKHEGDWRDVRVWSRHVSLYLTREDARQIENEVYLCIRFKGKWEPAWKGSYKLPIAYKSFYCNKKYYSSRWECFACEICRGEDKEKIYEHLVRYREVINIEHVAEEVERPIKTSVSAEIVEYGVYDMAKGPENNIEAKNSVMENASSEATLIEPTLRFRLEQGLGIGFKYKVVNLGTYPSNEIEVIAYIPEPEGHSSKSINPTRFKQPLSHGTGIYEIEFIYFFDTDSEMVPGEWKFEVLDRENVLAEITFDVYH